MQTMIELEQTPERLLLAAVDTGRSGNVEENLTELGELVRTAGGIPSGILIQNREAIHPGLYFGTGKLEEIRAFMEMEHLDGIVVDDELSPAQYNNLSEALSGKVIDRTMLILDIFAKRAQSSEGKIQVELAQLRYRSARLTGLGRSLSRLGGGIGTRGPGEKKLEMDRRLIGKRIAQLKDELAEVERHRDLTRTHRKGSGKPVVALVGYTNAGKSTLLNYLTEANVLAEDALFATLDPTTRLFRLPTGREALLVDTVGFIQKLPHQLIDAFRSTLEEAAYADLILHVVDAANPRMDSQMEVVYATLTELGAGNKPVITVFNKTDLLESANNHLTDTRSVAAFLISARTGSGMEVLLTGIEEALLEGQELVEGLLPYTDAGLLARIREEGTLLLEDYQPEGIRIRAQLPPSIAAKIKKHTDVPGGQA
ncbi:MAG: GTPase HflX [Lachnospiraceae bacterium]